ncbi:alcohol dehydrogenase catalytic domain-containing protein [Agrococcus sp. SGAir0287]|uniref:alcohol dehydrogenase catalytic domain-containing protein n=1 Tax=Agrococcus sp. SGAir0287 TaxID=2070347 RepID=UPI0010CD5F9F|nr:alcohol dehydrogenase catalytic domain-containing protein [Agrococcus sp. SGAir0287]QCR19125.1 glutathione-dependent formaldehyde dehydrogenase [Agrococcus sp. SGAir0287]
MRALTWHGIEDVRIAEVDDPRIEQPTDAIVRVTSTAICGSDLHLYRVLAPYLRPGDVLGHETMGVVEEVGDGVTRLQVGDRVVVPFVIACGSCWMCERQRFSQCETTQNREQGTGASLFGYTSMYGAVPGGQAERLRVPFADVGPIVVGTEHPDERYLYLSDILPTAYQALQYADVADGGTLGVVGLGPVGQLVVRLARRRGIRVIGVDPQPERRALAEEWGATAVDVEDAAQAMRDATDGRGPDAVVEAVGMEAHGNPVASAAISVASRLPKPIAQAAIEQGGIDRLAALMLAIDAVRRGGTVSISGVYGGAADPMPMRVMFDKGLQLRMGQCDVQRWVDDLLPIVEEDGDVLGLESLATHRLPLDEAPGAYRTFQRKEDGCIKVVLKPELHRT